MSRVGRITVGLQARFRQIEAIAQVPVPASRISKTVANTEALEHAQHYSTPVRPVAPYSGSIAPVPRDLKPQPGAWIEPRNVWRSL